MPWTWLPSWLRRRRWAAAVSVLMYTRQGCHLCDEAWHLLEELAERYPLRLEKADIDADPALRARHGERVPVLVIGGKERMWGRINRVLLERQVRAEASRDPGSAPPNR